MKSILSLLTMAAVAVLIPAAAHSQDLSLSNPSFENANSARNNVPEGWVKFPVDSGGFWDDSEAHEGRHSVRIEYSGKSGTYWQTENRHPVHEGQVITFRGWIKLEKGYGDNELIISWFDSNGKWLSSSRSEKQNGTCDWREVSVEAAVPTGAKSARFLVGRRFGTDDGVCWFDQLSASVKDSNGQNSAQAPKSMIPNNAAPNWANVMIPSREGREMLLATGAGNLLANGNLESGNDAQPVGWSRLEEQLGDGRWEPRRDKIRSLSITDTLAASVGWRSDPVLLSDLKEVTLAMRVMLKRAYHVRIGLEWLDTANDSLGVTLSREMDGDDTAWQWSWLTALVPAQARYARVVVVQNRSSGTSFLGDFSLTAAMP